MSKSTCLNKFYLPVLLRNSYLIVGIFHRILQIFSGYTDNLEDNLETFELGLGFMDQPRDTIPQFVQSEEEVSMQEVSCKQAVSEPRPTNVLSSSPSVLEGATDYSTNIEELRET